jgi:acyl-CoA thioester hydrolase
MTQSALTDFVERYPITVEIPVAWGEMDAFQHVNNIVYFRYFETARIALFEETGFVGPATGEGVGPILAATDCRFRIPLTYPDTVTAAAWVGDIGDDRFVMKYAVFSHRHMAVAAEGSGRIVAFDYGRGAKAPLPERIVAALHRLQVRD